MRALEFPANHIVARATSGQRLEIHYDPKTNAVLFLEDDWAADARGGAASRNAFREQRETTVIRRLRRRAA
jgi:hypothetical protein